MLQNSDHGKSPKRTVIITGASGRLGSRMVSFFREQGFRVVGIGRGSDFEADLTDEPATVETFAEIGRRHGAIWALVHTVGTWEERSLEQSSLRDWQRMQDINLTSTFLCFREAVSLMAPNGGRLIAITSQQGADGARANQAAYAAAKAGVVRLVEAVAEELHPRGIMVYALVPSTIIYDGNVNSRGILADQLVTSAIHLCGPSGQIGSGDMWRMYQSRKERS